jgi:hypothetical protein
MMGKTKKNPCRPPSPEDSGKTPGREDLPGVVNVGRNVPFSLFNGGSPRGVFTPPATSLFHSFNVTGSFYGLNNVPDLTGELSTIQEHPLFNAGRRDRPGVFNATRNVPLSTRGSSAPF